MNDVVSETVDCSPAGNQSRAAAKRDLVTIQERWMGPIAREARGAASSPFALHPRKADGGEDANRTPPSGSSGW
jgi:hypothetical protein